ncbi:protease modulator HflC [Halovulum sp. GXIMD14793]
MNRTFIFIAVLVIVAVTALSSVFVVDERKKALVIQFGQIKRPVEKPGLAFKVPFIQEVEYFDARIQSLDTPSDIFTLSDNRRLVIDAFARWRIDDIILFRQRVAGSVDNAEQKLQDILRNSLGEVLGNVPSNDVLSADRATLMTSIRNASITQAREFGVELIDVRIKRADFTPELRTETFNRMKAEREREAADERARGQEAAQRIRALANRTAVELVSEAQRDADVIRGEADAERNKIFAEAFGKDPEFFSFYRSLQAYEKALQQGNSSMVMAPDSEFFEYLKTDTQRDAE